MPSVFQLPTASRLWRFYRLPLARRRRTPEDSLGSCLGPRGGGVMSMGFVLCASVFSGYPPYISTLNVSTPQDTSFEPGPYPRAQAVLEIHASKVEAIHRLSAVLWSRYMGCKLYLRWSTPPPNMLWGVRIRCQNICMSHITSRPPPLQMAQPR